LRVLFWRRFYSLLSGFVRACGRGECVVFNHTENFMIKFSTLAAAAALAVAGVSGPALAQDAGVAVGATIYGPDGGAVGTIEQVEGDNVVINTGNMTATVPASVLGDGDNGPTMGWNKADFEAAISAAEAEAQAALEASLQAGAEVYSVDGVLLGTIDSVNDEGLVVVELAGGPVALGKEQMTLQGDKLTFLATAADVEAAAAAAAQGG
jgi:preprotein translocase subunit YajC